MSHERIIKMPRPAEMTDGTVGLRDFFTPDQQQGIDAQCVGMGTNPEITYAAHLAALAGAVGNLYQSRLRKYTIRPNLFLALIGPPSSGKTEPLKAALYAAWDADKRLDSAYGEAYTLWEASSPASPPPVRRSVVPSDFSQQSLQLMLAQGCAPLIYQDELLRLFGRGRSGTGEDFALLANSAWSGYTGTVVYKHSRSISIDNAIISIVGGIQPAMLPKLLDDYKLESGLFSRFLICWPDDLQAPRLSATEDNSRDEKYEYSVRGTFTHLYEIYARRADDEAPHQVPFSEVAETAAIELYNQLGHEIDKLSDTDMTRPGLGKLRTYLLRFALLHSINRAAALRKTPVQINIEDVEAAANLCAYFRRNINKVDASTTTQKRNRHPATGKVIAAWYAEAYDALPNNRAFDVKTLNAAIEPFIPREVNPKAAKYTFKTRMVELGRLLEIDGMLTKAEPDRAGSQAELSHLPDYLTP